MKLGDEGLYFELPLLLFWFWKSVGWPRLPKSMSEMSLGVRRCWKSSRRARQRAPKKSHLDTGVHHGQ
ncbi:MAG: hypothetical protein IPI44_17435 [Sulfuritalea sp.]|nr:hypothetical protein [Sulfuritalea sp.]